MPNHKSAEKRDRQNARRSAVNTANRTRLRGQVKRLRVAVASSKGEEAKAMHSETISLIDKAVQKRILHRNAAARYKSRLTRHVNKVTAK